MEDKIMRFLAYDGKISVVCANTTNLVEKARKIHDLSPLATATFGRLLTITSIMAQEMKNSSDKLTIQIKGNGPIGILTAVADSKGNVKGYVGDGKVDLPLRKSDGKLDVGGAVGKQGMLYIIKDLGIGKPYVGMTPIVSGEIAEDFTNYFATSEQVPSAVGLGVLVDVDGSVKQAGGFIIQMMPYAEEETISKLEKKIAEFKSVTYALEHEHTPEKMMEDLLGDMDMKIYEKVPTQFHCNCSKERVEKAVISVGKKEIQNMIDDGEPIEVNCHFCNTHYHYSVDDLKRMLNEATR